MSAILSEDSLFGVLTPPSTLTLKRTLPGPIERVWSYLIDGELRKQWLAAGHLDPHAGSSFELVWRNDQLSVSASERPAGFSEESTASCRVTEVDSPHKLSFQWPGVGDVTFQLDPIGDDVVLTVTHRGLADRNMTLMVGAGWHMHCDILAARLKGETPASFWSGWARLRNEYDRRIAA